MDSKREDVESYIHETDPIYSDGSGHEPSLDQDDRSKDKLARKLSARQINMITIAGVIGTGLFLGTGKSLATGGPASLLICYVIIGGVVMLTMLSLGEMATVYPVSGSFCTYAKRFGSDSLGFAILTNYAFNDMCSVASDLVAVQMVWDYWNVADRMPYWAIALIFWFLLLVLNVIDVRLYGEAEYWLAILKVATIIIFFIISIIVNAGYNNLNNGHGKYIGFRYWGQGDAPFVDGFRGFANVFVTAAFAYGGTESITLTAGETKNPQKVIPRTIKTVFWRILFFYVLTCFFIGMNVPYDYPGLSSKKVITSPFTIVYGMVGHSKDHPMVSATSNVVNKAAGSYVNVTILLSVILAGNHALFAGARLMYNLGTQGYFPRIFTWTNRFQVPYVGVISVWAVGGLAFGLSFIGSGTVWSWLQSIVGLSNLITWWVINLVSIRFRMGLKKQGKTDILLFKNWTYPLGPWAALIVSTFIILVQGWSSFSPWDTVLFFQNYLELGVFPVCYLFWFFWTKCKDRWVKLEDMDFESDLYVPLKEEEEENEYVDLLKGWAKFRHNFTSNFL